MQHYFYGVILLALTSCCGCATPIDKANVNNFVLPKQVTEAGIVFNFAPGFDRAKGMIDYIGNNPKNDKQQLFHLYLKGKPFKDYGMITTGDHVRFTSNNQVFVNGVARLPKKLQRKKSGR